MNHLATSGSTLIKFVGAACRINMSLLNHQDPTICIEACDGLLYQILWNSEADVRHFLLLSAMSPIYALQVHLPNELLSYVAYYVGRLDKGEYISSGARCVRCTGGGTRLFSDITETGSNLSVQ